MSTIEEQKYDAVEDVEELTDESFGEVGFNNYDTEPKQEEQKPSPKKQKRQKALTVFMPIYYGVLLLGAIICLTTHCLDGIFTNADPSQSVAGEGKAYAFAILMLIIAFSPSILLYYAAASPYNLSRKLRGGLFAIGVLLLIGMVALYIMLGSQYNEIYNACGYVFGKELMGLPLTDAVMFPATVVLGAVCFIAYYGKVMSNKELRKRGKFGKTAGFINSITKKDNVAAQIIVTIVLTLLLPIVSAIVFAIITFVLIVVMFFLFMAIMASLGGSGSSKSSSSDEIRVYYNGFWRTLTKTDRIVYEDGKQKKVYVDDTGRDWLKASGNKFYPRS